MITDHHSLCWLHNLKEATGRLARWALKLQNYDFSIIHRKGREHVVPDMLSRSVPEILEINVDEITKAKDKWYFSLLAKVRQNPILYPSFKIVNDCLYKHVRCSYPELHLESDNWKEVVPKYLRSSIISKSHDSPTSGHTGIFKTFKRISQKYYWPKMRSDITNYVNHCLVCAQHKPEQKKIGGLMSTRPQPVRPWQTICMDLVGPLPRTSKGYVYILVISDCFSKFPLIFPL